ncbi:Uncharacterised protein [Streptococcus pneumoniae]|nr:Uncharacterised protein [Streptococcus pneumoniae]
MIPIYWTAVLDEVNNLVGQWRENDAEGLRQDNQAHGTDIGKTLRQGGLHLTTRNRLNP